METQTRLKPPAIWTETQRSGGYPSRPYTTCDSVYSPRMRSPNIPNPLYPRSPAYDNSMRRHERAMVGRLDQRNWPGPAESPTSHGSPRTLAPITELHGRDRRSSIACPPYAHSYAHSSHSPTRPLDYDYPRRPTMAEEPRAIPFIRPPEPPRSTVHISLAERRRSLPPSLPAARRAARQRRQELQAWGHVYFGNGSEADCFVNPCALARRPSDASSVEGSGTEENAADREKEYRRQSRLTIRARIRPRALDRKPFLLTRVFDMDEIRATVPDPEPTSPASRRQSADYPTWKSRPYDPARPDREPGKAPAKGLKIVPIRESTH